MRKISLVVAVTLVLLLPAVAGASHYDRWCGTRQAGWVVGQPDANYNYPYEVRGPWHIKLTHAEALRLNRRFPVQEFGGHVSLADTACLVGQSVADSASQAWIHWSGNDGTVKVVASTSGGSVYLGRFHCRGHRRGRVFKETCALRHRGGPVIGSFTIRPTSG